jgi:N-hydroxyarylamine O-acetyltransferase
MEGYLERIAAERPARADADALRELQVRHLLTVPFENLSIHLREPIVLEHEALVAKVVDRHRGGFCYELNGAFAALLWELGYGVTLLAARVHGPKGLGPPFDHLALRVDTPEAWLVDVGFGRHAQHPLRLDVRGDQDDPDGVYEIREVDQGDLDVYRNGVPQYRLEQRPRVLRDCEATAWWHQTSPKSHFTQSTVCSMLTPTGRVTLSDRLLIVTDADDRTEHTLADDAEVLAAYRDRFGIVLDRVPEVLSPLPE